MRTRLAVALATGAALFGGAATANADTTVNVTSTSTPGWITLNQTGGIGSLVSGPAAAPLGWGSFKLDTSTSNVNAKVQFQTDRFRGTALSSITGIGYSTYRTSPAYGSASNASLNLVASLNSAIPFATLVYEPYWQTGGNNGILNDQWQNWDAYAGKWWSSRIPGCGDGSPCSWSTIVSMYPSATIYNVAGSPTFGLNQGTYNAGAVSYADALYLSVNGEKTTFNFDPSDTIAPTCGEMVVRRGAGPGGADQADVSVTDAGGSGIASITNFTVTNGTASVEPFTPGTASSVKFTATKTTPGVPTRFEFDVTDRAGNTTHCV